jgi:hypothetical protein
MKMILALLACCCIGFTNDFLEMAKELVGYTIIDIKTVNGEFEGCDFDKKVIFTDNTYVTCMGYGHTYSYMPEAIILGKNYNGTLLLKIYVDGELYDVMP